MKKIKLLCLITVILLMCTGCSVEYNINITKDNIEEIINVTDNITENRTLSDIKNHYNMWYPTFVNFVTEGESIEIEDFSEKYNSIEYHTKSITEIPDGYKYQYKYNYKIDEYYDSYAVASAFVEYTIHNGSNSLVLKTKGENILCQYNYFDSLTVNIKVDSSAYKLNTTNATNKQNNTYTWYFDRNDCNNSDIVLTLDKITKNEENIPPTTKPQDNDNQSKKNNYTMYIFYGILLFLVLIGYFIFRKIKLKNENFDLDD